MTLFQDTSYDFLRRKWLFLGLSLLVLCAGLADMARKGGPRYGIEFQGGALMTVEWPGGPPVGSVRAAVGEHLPGATVVEAHGSSAVRELLISGGLREGAEPTAARQSILAALDGLHTLTPYRVRGFEVIGPQVSGDLRNQALRACMWASFGMLGYLAWRFEWRYGAAAVLAMVHDTLITLGLFSLTNQEITLNVVAAILTLIGYSMNDTIVVFDRVRENLQRKDRTPLADVVNHSINQTLSRTVLTSGLTLLSALALLLFGGPVLRGFAFALVVGIVVGTYSTFFVASPLLVLWHHEPARQIAPASPVANATLGGGK